MLQSSAHGLSGCALLIFSSSVTISSALDVDLTRRKRRSLNVEPDAPGGAVMVRPSPVSSDIVQPRAYDTRLQILLLRLFLSTYVYVLLLVYGWVCVCRSKVQCDRVAAAWQALGRWRGGQTSLSAAAYSSTDKKKTSYQTLKYIYGTTHGVWFRMPVGRKIHIFRFIATFLFLSLIFTNAPSAPHGMEMEIF